MPGHRSVGTVRLLRLCHAAWRRHTGETVVACDVKNLLLRGFAAVPTDPITLCPDRRKPAAIGGLVLAPLESRARADCAVEVPGNRNVDRVARYR